MRAGYKPLVARSQHHKICPSQFASNAFTKIKVGAKGSRALCFSVALQSFSVECIVCDRLLRKGKDSASHSSETEAIG